MHHGVCAARRGRAQARGGCGDDPARPWPTSATSARWASPWSSSWKRCTSTPPSWTSPCHGVTLRRRTGGDDAGWHLKLPQGTDTRTELRRPLGGATETVPTELLEPVRALVRDRQLVPVARVSTRRLQHALMDEDAVVLAQVCDDQVHAERLHGPVAGPGLARVGGGAGRRRPGGARCGRTPTARGRRRAGDFRVEARSGASATRSRPPQQAFPQAAAPGRARDRYCGPTWPSRSPSCTGRTEDCGPTTPARSTSCASRPADCVLRSRPTSPCSSPDSADPVR